MSDQDKKKKSDGPNLARAGFIAFVLCGVWSIVAIIHGVNKHNASRGSGGPYAAAVAEHAYESSGAPMTDAQKEAFVGELKAARLAQAKEDIRDALTRARLAVLDKELQGVWRTLIVQQGTQFEYFLGLTSDEYVLFYSISADQGLSKASAWKIIGPVSEDSVTANNGATNLTLKPHLCLTNIAKFPKHAFDRCLSAWDGDQLVAMAYKDRDLSAQERNLLLRDRMHYSARR